MSDLDGRLKQALSRLVTAALARNDLSVLGEMLLVIAREIGAEGCALWQVQPLSDGTMPSPAHPDTRIFVLAEGVPENLVCAYHDVPLLKSATGEAMTSGRVNIRDIRDDPRVGKTGPFLKKAGIHSLGSVRIMIDESTLGALTIYRKALGGFTETEFEIIEYLGSHVPMLYRAIRDRKSLRLIEEVNSEIRKTEVAELPPAGMFKAVSRVVSHLFQCLETSIYLENPRSEPGVLQLMATTCPGFIRKNRYTRGDYGLTTWVWSRKRPIKVFDLQTFDMQLYDGLEWHDDVRIREKTRALLRLNEPNEDLPPISFMAVPIMAGDRALGVLRCCAASQGPYYFADREVALLEVIATRVGQFWNNELRRQELEGELSAWNRFVSGVSELNQSIQHVLTSSAGDHSEILSKALDVVAEAVPPADILDVSLFDPASRELTVAAVRGKAWLAGGPDAVAARKARLACRVDETPVRSPGGVLFRRRALLDLRLESDQSGQFTPAFAGVKRAIFSPIMGDGEFIGIISMQRTGAIDFPARARAIIELVSQQIGLYLRLAFSIQRQTDTYHDFQHQLRSPVFQAYKRILRVEQVEGDSNLEAVRGLIGKAQRVVTNLRLYADLIAGRKIPLTSEVVALRELVKPLIEAASDNRILRRDKGIAFHVITEAFEPKVHLRIDSDLFAEVVNNILDNAGKYGARRSEVTISAIRRDDTHVAIVVTNKGIPMTEEEALHAPERGWQGKGKQLAGEGSGVGLWIVDNIMKAHGGFLQVNATNALGITEVALVFPVAQDVRVS